MANIYVDSNATGGSQNGTSWANAYLTLAAATAGDAAGDTIYVSDNHAESSASTQTIALAGTAASPVRVICGNDAAEPPTSAATTATVTTTGANGITFTGTFYMYGLTFNAGTGTSNASMNLGGGEATFYTADSCIFRQGTTSTSGRITFTGAYNSQAARLINCLFKFSATGQGFSFGAQTTRFFGGGIESGSSAITTLIKDTGARALDIKFYDFDVSNAASSLTLMASGVVNPGAVTFVNCKLPASWSGGVVAGAPSCPGFRASMYNCDSGATNYRLWIETYAGSIKSETTLVKTGGASDGTTAISWKLTTTANANEIVAPLITDDMAIWIDSTGSSKTITVDILHDSTTALTDAEVWLEIDYLGSSSQPLGTPASDKRATVLTTAADQTTSSATWTTTGLSNPNKQKLEVTFTPNMKGFVYARVCLAKASYTIYVDPEPVIS